MDKEQTAIQRLQLAAKMSERYYHKPLLLCYSGGKDSDVCIALAQAAGIPFEVQHSHTTADAPETVYYVRKRLHELELQGVPVTVNYPVYKGKPTSMWDLIPQKLMPPTRIVRYCCSVLKETAGRNRAIVTGVRSGESYARSSRTFAEVAGKTKKDTVHIDYDDVAAIYEDQDGRSFTEHDEKFKTACRIQGGTIFNPIIDWDDSDVWDYIRDSQLLTNPLYQCGFSRVGCVGCPMAGGKRQLREFSIYPKYRDLYILAFDRMLDVRRAHGKIQGTWRVGTTGIDVFHWWVEDGVLPGQMEIEEVTHA